METASSSLPADLAAAHRSFAEWRSTRTKHCRIPPALWRAAVRCARKHGVYRTAQALRLDHKYLKQRLQAGSGTCPARKEAVGFVELSPGAWSALAQCRLELESPRGTKLRLELTGSAVPDLVELARRFAAEDI
jgi:hypothetical protein